MADLIVLGGCAALEKASENAGFKIEVPFSQGRTDAREEETDTESFNLLNPVCDAFRSYKLQMNPEEFLIDKAQLLKLTAPQMTVLIGGLRVLRTNYKDSDYGVFTENENTLSNDYFVHLLDMNTHWKPQENAPYLFDGIDTHSGQIKWTASRADLIFGSNSQLRAIAEVYASDDAKEKFIIDFIAAWNKVMNADRFDLM